MKLKYASEFPVDVPVVDVLAQEVVLRVDVEELEELEVEVVDEDELVEVEV